MRAPGALHAMTHPFGFQLSKKYVCVSTVAPSPAHIRALKPLPARLAWSVHALPCLTPQGRASRGAGLRESP